MARAPFKLKSQGSSFKMMGSSSPVKQQTNTEKYDKQQNIANPDGGNWPSGKPKTYKSLQDDGTYKVLTNKSGSESMSAEQLKNTHVTKKQHADNREAYLAQQEEKSTKKREKKQKRKNTIKNVKKKIVSAIKDPLGIKYRNKKRIEKAYNEGMDS
tara:strand:- start:115 stop:582 length:468 start_codon:yes stop_codon:yes gene_type:complete